MASRLSAKACATALVRIATRERGLLDFDWRGPEPSRRSVRSPAYGVSTRMTSPARGRDRPGRKLPRVATRHRRRHRPDVAPEQRESRKWSAWPRSAPAPAPTRRDRDRRRGRCRTTDRRTRSPRTCARRCEHATIDPFRRSRAWSQCGRRRAGVGLLPAQERSLEESAQVRRHGRQRQRVRRRRHLHPSAAASRRSGTPRWPAPAACRPARGSGPANGWRPMNSRWKISTARPKRSWLARAHARRGSSCPCSSGGVYGADAHLAGEHRAPSARPGTSRSRSGRPAPARHQDVALVDVADDVARAWTASKARSSSWPRGPGRSSRPRGRRAAVGAGCRGCGSAGGRRTAASGSRQRPPRASCSRRRPGG